MSFHYVIIESLITSHSPAPSLSPSDPSLTPLALTFTPPPPPPRHHSPPFRLATTPPAPTPPRRHSRPRHLATTPLRRHSPLFRLVVTPPRHHSHRPTTPSPPPPYGFSLASPASSHPRMAHHSRNPSENRVSCGIYLKNATTKATADR